MIKLIVDCTSEIDEREAKELGIISIPMKVNFEEKEYLAGVNLKNDEFFTLLSASKTLPKTAQLNTADFLDVIKPLIEAGDEVFVMSLSSELSGTFNSLKLASEEINSKNLKIFDTETVTFAYYALVIEAIRFIKEGATLAELEKKMKHLRTKVKLLAIIDNVKYLIKGGRLSLAKGLLASAFNIKPIVSMVNKKLQMVAKAIGYNGAKKQLCKLVTNVDENMSIYYGHSNASEKAEDFKSCLEENFGFKFAKKCDIGPVIGTHAGPNCVGVVYFEK